MADNMADKTFKMPYTHLYSQQIQNIFANETIRNVFDNRNLKLTLSITSKIASPMALLAKMTDIMAAKTRRTFTSCNIPI